MAKGEDDWHDPYFTKIWSYKMVKTTIGPKEAAQRAMREARAKVKEKVRPKVKAKVIGKLQDIKAKRVEP